MTVTHPPAIRNAMADLIATRLDGGQLVFVAADGKAVASLQLNDPAFADAIDGVAAAHAITRDASSTGGVIVRAELRDNYGGPVVRCAVTDLDGEGDIRLSSLTLAPTQAVEISSLAYEAAP